jgi:hypothetical protein
MFKLPLDKKIVELLALVTRELMSFVGKTLVGHYNALAELNRFSYDR